jgi:hypothetical protein
MRKKFLLLGPLYVKYKIIIQEAWALTQENKFFVWVFAFIPALLTSLVSMVYMVYQVIAFWESDLFNGEGHFFEELISIGWNFIQDNPGLAVVMIILLGLLALAYVFLPVFTQGALIQLIVRKRTGHEVNVMSGISYGFNRFLQLLEYHVVVKTFSAVGIFSMAALVLREWGPDAFYLFGWIFLLFFIIGMVLSLLFTYSEYYLVIDKEQVFNSMIRSGKLVVHQWHHTLFMFILMVIISLRILINLFIALLVPALVVGPVFLFASVTLAKIGVVIGSLVGLVALLFGAYFLGVFHVFATAVWTFTFLELTQEGQETDLREDILRSENQEQVEESKS